ncbi:transposase [Streptomyces sp. NPDC051909]|uniref:transposase n=1 Tax=Streptomyces sp. NPDC051909 TaxID=3154944 RepID=UPI003423E80C
MDNRPLTGWSVLEVDASFVPAPSEKEGAEPHRKGFGLHPLLVFLDDTDEHLVCRLRPGSAGANTAADRIDVATEAVRQLPTRRRGKVLFRADGAGATKEWLVWITTGGGNKAYTWEYSVGWSRDEDFWTGPAKVPRRAWMPAPDAKGQPREDAGLVEITRPARPRRMAARSANHRPPRTGPPQVHEGPEALRARDRLPLRDRHEHHRLASAWTPGTGPTRTSSPGSVGRRH